MATEQQRRLYPVGIQTFSELRTKGYLYIDKTEQVYRMARSGTKYVFLSRPRRFGKSLLTSTLRSYFEGRKDLFKGLAIELLEKEWTQYPVLHFDMSTAKHQDKEGLEQELSLKLTRYEEVYGRGKDEKKLNSRLEGLIKRLCERTGKQVIYIIFTLMGYYADVEVRTPTGRVDMVMRTRDTLYLIELKLNRSAEAAMSQIDLKDYASHFSLTGLPIVKVGINFDPGKHTISDWKIEK